MIGRLGTSRWGPMTWIVLGNLIPLVLVLVGAFDTVTMLLALTAEVTTLLLVRLPDLIRAALPTKSLVLVLVVGTSLIAGAYAILFAQRPGQTAALVAIASGVAFVAFGYWQFAVDDDPETHHPVGPGLLGFRTLLVFIGVILGVPTANAFDQLSAFGWDPGSAGDLMDRVGFATVEVMQLLHLPAGTLPAVMVFGYKLFNEVVWELLRLAREVPGGRAASSAGA